MNRISSAIVCCLALFGCPGTDPMPPPWGAQPDMRSPAELPPFPGTLDCSKFSHKLVFVTGARMAGSGLLHADDFKPDTYYIEADRICERKSPKDAPRKWMAWLSVAPVPMVGRLGALARIRKRINVNIEQRWCLRIGEGASLLIFNGLQEMANKPRIPVMADEDRRIVQAFLMKNDRAEEFQEAGVWTGTRNNGQAEMDSNTGLCAQNGVSWTNPDGVGLIGSALSTEKWTHHDVRAWPSKTAK